MHCGLIEVSCVRVFRSGPPVPAEVGSECVVSKLLLKYSTWQAQASERRMAEVEELLAGAGLDDFASALLERGYNDVKTLAGISDAELEEAGMKGGHKIRLRQAMKEALPPAASLPGDPTCWIGGFSPGLCCSRSHGPRGNQMCWDGTFTFERCCGGVAAPPAAEMAAPAQLPEKQSEEPLSRWQEATTGFGPSVKIEPVPDRYLWGVLGAILCAGLVHRLIKRAIAAVLPAKRLCDTDGAGPSPEDLIHQRCQRMKTLSEQADASGDSTATTGPSVRQRLQVF
eukprot:TRINITY_DN47327_c0_g1_i1.p1 TRINITY_DN47327_c0_g1~~TRINITY_DN47327_c0_g1_i1.p1  ORF type:complete len:284 (+),score=37.67 TRINITY_DN47327_c0_g1_i1:202-1053(+)